MPGLRSSGQTLHCRKIRSAPGIMHMETEIGNVVAFFTSSIPRSSITNPVALAFNELQDVDTSVEVFSHHMY